MRVECDLSEVDEMLKDMTRRAALDSDEFYSHLGTDMESEVNRSFEVEGPDWEQLAPLTVKIRVSRGYPGSHPIGEQSGALKRGWWNAKQERFPGGMTLINDSVNYASKFHQGDPGGEEVTVFVQAHMRTSSLGNTYEVRGHERTVTTRGQPARDIKFDEEFLGEEGEKIANYVITGEWDFGFGK